MTRAKSEGQERAPNDVELPGDKNAATLWVFRRLKKLRADRKWSADGVKQAIKDAKEKDMSSRTCRTIIALDKMTPEKRLKWQDDLAAAARLYGIEIGTAEGDVKPNDDVAGLIERARFLDGERRDLSEEIKMVREAAVASDLDLKSIDSLLKMHERHEDDVNAMRDEFDGLDYVGRIIGVWD